MIDTVRTLKSGLVQVLEWALMGLMGVLVLDVLWGILWPFLAKLAEKMKLEALADLLQSPWTNELATMLLIWVALLGAAVAFARNSHLGVDYFVNKLAPGPKKAVEVLVQLIIVFFAVVILIYGGIRIVTFILDKGQASPALGVQMGYVYLALPISGFLVLLVAAEQLLERVAGAADDAQRGEG